MAHGPDIFVSSARSSAEVPQLVGQRVEAARAYAASAGWSLHVRPVAADRQRPAGFVVAQQPPPGHHAAAGAVLVVDVSTPRRLDDRHARAVLGGVATALAVVAGVFASLWLDERADRPDVVPAPDWVGGPRAVVDEFAADHDLVVVIEPLPLAASVDDGGSAAGLPADGFAGVVVAQVPSPGVPLAPGSVVVLTVAEDER